MSEVGRLLAGRYRVGELIGHGGMSDVYRGVDARLGRTVAIKILKSSLATDPSFRTRFRQEAQAASRMAHPTIVRVFDAGEEIVSSAGREVQLPFIVMELVTGRLLKDILAGGALEPSEAVRIMEGILTALEYSHRAGVVHRDIKPGNIMITETGQVKVMDFGIARAVSESSATVAQTTTILGTASYFSPEQARGETVDARTDLYSAGVVLFEMLTGQVPFRGDSPVAVAYQHVSERPTPPSLVNPRVSPALDQVVLHALAKNRFDRYQSASDFRADVEAAARGRVPERREDDVATTLFGVPQQPSTSEQVIRQLVQDQSVVRTQNRPPAVWIWAGVASVAVILAAVMFWVFSLSPSDKPAETMRKIPELSAVTYESAASTLTALGLIPSRVDEDSTDVPPNHVVRSEPPAAVMVKPGTVVKLYISLGERQVDVPDLRNLSLDDATKALKDAELVAGQVDRQNSPTVPENVVMGSSPEFGETVTPGDTVDIIVSNGKVMLPNVEEMSMAAAIDILTSPDLQLRPNSQPDPTCPSEPNTPVSHQSLPRGPVDQDSEVVLQYCTG